jgi:hypothetical protein
MVTWKNVDEFVAAFLRVLTNYVPEEKIGWLLQEARVALSTLEQYSPRPDDRGLRR